MMLKKSTLLGPSCASALHLHGLSAGTSSSSFSSSRTHPQTQVRSRLSKKHGINASSTVSASFSSMSSCRAISSAVPDSSLKDETTLHAWPEPVHPNVHPTPYQIFGLGREAEYSKKRFYELAKLYHPDSCPAHMMKNLPDSVRMERYRLIVAAHALLSNPAKRNVYDRYGTGWHGPQPDAYSRPWGEGRGTYKGWQNNRAAGSDPMHNATWEDWERWYQEHDESRPPQTPVYLSNIGFVTIIIMCAMLVNVGQATYANNWGSTVMQHRDAKHAEASKELYRARSAARSGDRDERIEYFLRQREATIISYQGYLPVEESSSANSTSRDEDTRQSS